MRKGSGNDSLARFARHAALARQEAAPEIDVRPQVLRRLTQIEASPVAPMAFLTLAAVGAAAIAVVVAFPAFSALNDPMGSLFQLSPLLGG